MSCFSISFVIGVLIILFQTSVAAQFHFYIICILCSLSAEQSRKTSGMCFIKQKLNVPFGLCISNFFVIWYCSLAGTE